MTEDPYECNYRDSLPKLEAKLQEIERSVVDDPDSWTFGEMQTVYWDGKVEFIQHKSESHIYWNNGHICSLRIGSRLADFFVFAPSQRHRVDHLFNVVKARNPK